MERTISFTLNGKPATVKVDDERMLLWVLRSDLGLTGTKFGCGEALCGACTVIVDKAGRPVVRHADQGRGRQAGDDHRRAGTERPARHPAGLPETPRVPVRLSARRA